MLLQKLPILKTITRNNSSNKLTCNFKNGRLIISNLSKKPCDNKGMKEKTTKCVENKSPNPDNKDDIYFKMNLLDCKNAEAVDKYFGNRYDNLEYHKYHRYAFNDVMAFLKDQRLPQPSSKKQERPAKPANPKCNK